MRILPWVAFIMAAVFEVAGDAVIRMGMKNGNVVLMIFGALVLAGYGLIVNSLAWNFSVILGLYVAVFAVTGSFLDDGFFEKRSLLSLGLVWR